MPCPDFRKQLSVIHIPASFVSIPIFRFPVKDVEILLVIISQGEEVPPSPEILIVIIPQVEDVPPSTVLAT